MQNASAASRPPSPVNEAHFTSNTSPGIKLLLCAGLTVVLGDLLALPVHAANILCVLRDRDVVTPGVQMLPQEDPPYLERLTNVLGHTVVLRGVSNGTDPASPDHAQTSDVTPGIDAIFISGSVASSQVGDVYRNVPVPVIFSENAIIDDFGMSDDASGQYANIFGAIAGQTDMVIVNPGHPMAAGLSGTVTVYNTPNQGRFNSALTNSQMVVIATATNESNRAVIFGYEKGACMYGLAAPARRVSLFLPETDTTNANAIGWALFDASVTWALSAPAVPNITLLSPTNSAVFVPSTNGISFQADSPQPIAVAGVKMVLNGLDESGNLVVSGGPTNRTVTFGGLASNRFYSAEITVSNALGTALARLRFDTFREADAVMVEAEDYNYVTNVSYYTPGLPAGQFQNDPPPSMIDDLGNRTPFDYSVGYANQQGEPRIDYFDTSTSAPSQVLNAYRRLDRVGTRVLASTNLTTVGTNYSDYARSKYLGAGVPDYFVRAIGTNDWMNYTRVFSSNSYHVYLRAHSLDLLQMKLDKVTSDITQSNQTTLALGSFVIQNCANCGFRFVPLTDGAGNPVSLSLSGTNTLRLTAATANVGLGVNYLVFLPDNLLVAPPRPTIQNPTLNGNKLVLSLATQSGQRYSVQYKDSIAQSGWSTLTTFGGDGAVTTLTNALSGASQRYFRVAVADNLVCE